VEKLCDAHVTVTKTNSLFNRIKLNIKESLSQQIIVIEKT